MTSLSLWCALSDEVNLIDAPSIVTKAHAATYNLHVAQGDGVKKQHDADGEVLYKGDKVQILTGAAEGKFAKVVGLHSDYCGLGVVNEIIGGISVSFSPDVRPYVYHSKDVRKVYC